MLGGVACPTGRVVAARLDFVSLQLIDCRPSLNDPENSHKDIQAASTLHVEDSMRKSKLKRSARPVANHRVPKEPLSEREIEVVRLLSLGCSIYDAAAILDLSSSTVDNYKAWAMKKLGVTKAALLTREAIKTGISSLNDRLTSAERRRLRERMSYR
jgi:DNA-binding CsgD family transcriptional regulator